MNSPAWLHGALSRVPHRVRVLTLGMLTWALWALLPSLYHHEATPFVDVVALCLGPGVLGIGCARLRLPAPVRPFVLLALFPIALSLATSRIDREQALITFSPGTLLLAIFSVAAFYVTALDSLQDGERRRRVEPKPLGEVAQVIPSEHRRRAALTLLGVVTLGALTALAFGTSATPAHYRERWGTAADAGAVVAALGAGILGCTALAMVAPALRAERGGDRRKDPNPAKRRSLLLLVATSGLVVYGFLR